MYLVNLTTPLANINLNSNHFKSSLIETYLYLLNIKFDENELTDRSSE